jgi:hypothetical protein
VAQREFTDDLSRKWAVWDVHPAVKDRRRAERRLGKRTDNNIDRRRKNNRRQRRNPAMILRRSADFSSGWLCFQCDNEKRRLAPVPDHWEFATPEELELLRQLAKPAPKKGMRIIPKPDKSQQTLA